MASITISENLLKDLEQILAQSKEFTDVSGYVGYILEQVVAKKKQATPAVPTVATYSKADEDKIRERLKNLGYLD